MAKLIILFITAFVDMVGFVIVLPLLPYYAKAFGANALLVGVLISSFSVAQLAVAPLWGRASDRYGRRPMIIAGLVLSSAAYLVFAFAGSVWLLLLSRVVQGMGGGTIGVVQAYVADATPPDQRTKSLGWLSAVTSFGAVVGPAFGSFLDQVGGRSAPGLAAAALAALIAVFAWRFLRESKEMRPSGAFHAAHPRTPGSAALRRVVSHPSEPASRLMPLMPTMLAPNNVITSPIQMLDFRRSRKIMTVAADLGTTTSWRRPCSQSSARPASVPTAKSRIWVGMLSPGPKR